MKTTFLLSLLLVLFSSDIFAGQTETLKKITLKKVNSNGGQQIGTRSVCTLDVFAHIALNPATLMVDLGKKSYEQTTLSVKSITTGETFCCVTYFKQAYIVIDMSEAECGGYLLEISLGETLLSGEFTVE